MALIKANESLLYFTLFPLYTGHKSQDDTSDHAQILVSVIGNTAHKVRGTLHSDQSVRKPPAEHLNTV
jgi:hypothetical protein